MDLRDLEQVWRIEVQQCSTKRSTADRSGECLGTSEKPFLAVAFDWDGTLADSDGLAIEALNAATKWARARRVEIPAALDSRSPETQANRIARDSHRLPQTDPVVAKFRELLLRGEREKVVLRPSARSLIEMLGGHGIGLAVISGRDRQRLAQAIRVSRLLDLFQCVVSSQDAQPKPHPSSLWRVAESLGVRLAKLRMVGDSFDDKEAARSAGVDYYHVGMASQP